MTNPPLRPHEFAEDVLNRRLNDIVPGGAVAGVRRIAVADDRLLTAAEAAGRDRTVPGRRRASGAARDIARGLLDAAIGSRPDILCEASGAPLWPCGIVGSLTHDDVVAAAVVAPAALLGGIGVDVEAAEPLEEELLATVTAPGERELSADDPLRGKVLFCVKEAVFKAVNPHDRRFLDFADITVEAARGIATTSYGRVVRWRAIAGPRVLAVAWW